MSDMRADPAETRNKWNRIHGTGDPVILPAPTGVLRENQHLLPTTGSALDLACGLGGNALFLARQGLNVTAIDISSEAIARVNNCALWMGVNVRTEIRDVIAAPPPAKSFDIIVVSRFLDRSLAGTLIDALKPGGLLFYQTFTREKVSDGGPSNPAYLLEPNEMLSLFASLRILVYREEGYAGDTRRGLRNEAQLVGQKNI